jgi:allophanate hydrolase subunit 1
MLSWLYVVMIVGIWAGFCYLHGYNLLLQANSANVVRISAR